MYGWGAGGGGLSTESTRLKPPLSCYHSNLNSGQNHHPTTPSPQDNDSTDGKSMERDKKDRNRGSGGGVKEKLKSPLARWGRSKDRAVRGHFLGQS